MTTCHGLRANYLVKLLCTRERLEVVADSRLGNVYCAGICACVRTSMLSARWRWLSFIYFTILASLPRVAEIIRGRSPLRLSRFICWRKCLAIGPGPEPELGPYVCEYIAIGSGLCSVKEKGPLATVGVGGAEVSLACLAV